MAGTFSPYFHGTNQLFSTYAYDKRDKEKPMSMSEVNTEMSRPLYRNTTPTQNVEPTQPTQQKKQDNTMSDINKGVKTIRKAKDMYDKYKTNQAIKNAVNINSPEGAGPLAEGYKFPASSQQFDTLSYLENTIAESQTLDPAGNVIATAPTTTEAGTAAETMAGSDTGLIAGTGDAFAAAGTDAATTEALAEAGLASAETAAAADLTATGATAGTTLAGASAGAEAAALGTEAALGAEAVAAGAGTAAASGEAAGAGAGSATGGMSATGIGALVAAIIGAELYADTYNNWRNTDPETGSLLTKQEAYDSNTKVTNTGTIFEGKFQTDPGMVALFGSDTEPTAGEIGDAYVMQGDWGGAFATAPQTINYWVDPGMNIIKMAADKYLGTNFQGMENDIGKSIGQFFGLI